MAAMTYREIFNALGRYDSGEGWWPGEGDFEIVIGAILTQNTNWRNVEKALCEMRRQQLFHPDAILQSEEETLQEAIRSAGYFRAKAAYLREISSWFLERHEKIRGETRESLRRELLSLHGVGPETADDLLLYVYEKPLFIFDTYGRRLLEAAGRGTYASYEQARRGEEASFFAEDFSLSEAKLFHGRIVNLGKVAPRGEGVAHFKRLLGKS